MLVRPSLLAAVNQAGRQQPEHVGTEMVRVSTKLDAMPTMGLSAAES